MDQQNWIVRAHATVKADTPEEARDLAQHDSDVTWTVDAVEEAATGREAWKRQWGLVAAFAATAAFPSKLVWDTLFGALT